MGLRVGGGGAASALGGATGSVLIALSAVSYSTAGLFTQLGLGLLFLTEGSRRISPPSVALIGSLDIPFAMLWVWLWFSEVPAVQTFWGGCIILLAVAWHMQKDFQLDGSAQRIDTQEACSDRERDASLMA